MEKFCQLVTLTAELAPYFIEAHIDDHMLSHSPAPSITIKRKSFDRSTNKHGKRLIKLCKSKQLSILNGRKEGDTLGMFKFISSKGSVIFYREGLPKIGGGSGTFS